MHTVSTDIIFPGVKLTCINTDKFKTGCLTVNFICKLDRATASSAALLPHVLRRGSAEHPDMQSIASALDELYGARVEPIVRKKGELQCIGFYTDFPDDRYIPREGEHPRDTGILEETASLLGGLLLSPDLHDGLLRTDYIEGEKSNLIDDIRAGINDKRGYSIDRLLEEMCADEPFGVSKLGSEEEAQKITPETLTEYYRDLISTAPVEAFYCGTAEPTRVADALREAFSGFPERIVTEAPNTGVALYPAGDSPRRFTEELDVTQGKLTVGYRLGKAMDNPDYPAMMVFNAVFGGCVTSKLFLNVRERLSLCYYAGSILERQKGVMLVASGVDFANFETALDEITAQLENIKRGDVSDWELTSAKRAVITSIRLAMDRPGGLEDLFFDSSVSAVPYDPDELCDGVGAVTLDGVIELASDIMLDSVYCLTGKGGDESEA